MSTWSWNVWLILVWIVFSAILSVLAIARWQLLFTKYVFFRLIHVSCL